MWFFFEVTALTVPVWDKRQTDMFTICAPATNRRMLQSTVLSSSFSLIGVKAVKNCLNTEIQSQLYTSALEHGIRDLAVTYKFLSRPSYCFPRKASVVFQLLKWKSQKAVNDLL